MTMIGIHVVGAFPPQYSIWFSRRYVGSGLMMLFRIYALFFQRKWVVASVGLLLLVQAGTNAWLLTRGKGTLHLSMLVSKFLILVVSTAVMHNPFSGVRGQLNACLFAA